MSTFIMIVCLLTALPVNSQINWGIKGGLNLNKASLDGLTSNFKSENTAGFFIGPMVDIEVPVVGFNVDGAVLFSQRTIKIAYEDAAGTVIKDVDHDQNAIEIPLNLNYSFGLGDLASLCIAIGPDFIFNFLKNDNLLRDINNMVGYPGDPESSDRKVQIAFNVGADVRLINHIQLGINYNILLTNSVTGTNEYIADAGSILSDRKFKTRNRTWQIAVAYIF